MNTAGEHLLVADDEAAYRKLLKQMLELAGWRVDVVADGAAVLRAVAQHRYALVLLDVMLPGMDGFDVCRKIRATSTVPIILVTALSEEAQIVTGLHTGADDYVTKPFSIPELTARVAAVLRRARLVAEPPAAPIRTGGLVIDIEGGTTTCAGRPVELTATEHRLLSYLARNVGRVLTHNQLLRQGWGEGYLDQPQLVHVTMSRLRAKIEPDPARPRHLLTRIGIGYTLAALPPDPD
jgi:two-component system response regulator RegX3